MSINKSMQSHSNIENTVHEQNDKHANSSLAKGFSLLPLSFS